MNQDNHCPLNESGHRFFLFKTYEVYEPWTITIDGGDEERAQAIALKIDDALEDVNMPQLYEKVEYAVSGCNCSAVRKIRVVQG